MRHTHTQRERERERDRKYIQTEHTTRETIHQPGLLDDDSVGHAASLLSVVGVAAAAAAEKAAAAAEGADVRVNATAFGAGATGVCGNGQ